MRRQQPETKLTTKRYLDAYEASRTRMYPAIAFAYRGRMDDRALTRAFHLLSQRYPILRARICPDHDYYVLEVPHGHYPALAVIDGDENTLLRETSEPLDIASEVAQLKLIRGNAQGYVALCTSRAIADDKARSVMVEELWRLYTDIARGLNVAVEYQVSLPSAPSEFLQERWSEIHPLNSVASAHTHGRIANLDVTCRRIQLDPESTTRLIAAARTHRTSVNAVLTGAIVVALHEHGSSADRGRMKVLSTVNLRNHVSPPVGPTETTTFNGKHIATVSMTGGANPFTIGIDIREQLTTAIRRREIHLVQYSTKEAKAFDLVQPQEIDLEINNAGMVAQIAHPEDLYITDYFPPLHLGRIKTSGFPHPTHAIYTYNKQLNIFCFYPSAQETVIDDVTEQLRLITKSHIE